MDRVLLFALVFQHAIWYIWLSVLVGLDEASLCVQPIPSVLRGYRLKLRLISGLVDLAPLDRLGTSGAPPELSFPFVLTSFAHSPLITHYWLYIQFTPFL